MRTRNFLIPFPLVALAQLLANAGAAHAQPAFEAPPAPTAPPSAVRGLYDPVTHASSPATIAPPVTAPPSKSLPQGITAGGSTQNAKPLEGGEIIARIDGQIVLASDILWQVNKILEANADRIPPAKRKEITDHLLRQQLMGMIDTKLLYADFRRTIPPENIPTVEANLTEPFEEHEIPRLMEVLEVESPQALEEELTKLGTSKQEMKRQFIERTIAGEWLRQRTPKPKDVSVDELREHYEKGVAAGEYDFPAKVRWEELMVRLKKHNGDRNAAWQAICALGNEVWRHVAANPDLRGPIFANIAVKKSDGFTAKKGGQHDWTTEGALRSDAINEALFSLQIGQMSDVIETEQGFHIVRVLERKGAGRTPFTEAQSDIRKGLEEEQRKELVESEVQKLRESSKIWTVYDGDISGKQFQALLKRRTKRR